MPFLSTAAALGLLTSGLPLLDVRSGEKRLKGALSGAVDLPILRDEERRCDRLLGRFAPLPS